MLLTSMVITVAVYKFTHEIYPLSFAALFLVSFFAIRKMSKDYFNNQVEKLIKIIDEEKKMFTAKANTGSNDLIDKLMNTITGSNKAASVLELNEIE